MFSSKFGWTNELDTTCPGGTVYLVVWLQILSVSYSTSGWGAPL